MDKRLLVIVASVIALVASSAAANQLTGGPIVDGPSLPPIDDAPGVCCMQNGFVVTQGVGCRNTSGTSGGPNDIAERTTLCTLAFSRITTFSYIVVTPGISGFVTGASFAVFRNSDGVPGDTMCLGPALPFLTAGTYSIPITSCAITTSMPVDGVVFFGIRQRGPGGMRWAYEDGAAANGAYLRAPACGADEFAPLSALGHPGSWVFRVCMIPYIGTEVEEFSWSEIKSSYR